jgi:hypothetical protein
MFSVLFALCCILYYSLHDIHVFFSIVDVIPRTITFEKKCPSYQACHWKQHRFGDQSNNRKERSEEKMLFIELLKKSQVFQRKLVEKQCFRYNTFSSNGLVRLVKVGIKMLFLEHYHFVQRKTCRWPWKKECKVPPARNGWM